MERPGPRRSGPGRSGAGPDRERRRNGKGGDRSGEQGERNGGGPSPAGGASEAGAAEGGGSSGPGAGRGKQREKTDWRKPAKRRGSGRRGGRKRWRKGGEQDGGPREGRPADDAVREEPRAEAATGAPAGTQEAGAGTRSRWDRRPKGKGGGKPAPSSGDGAPPAVGSGMFVLEKGGFGVLRSQERQWLPSKEDIFVPQRLIQQAKLRDGAIVEGRLAKGQKHKYQLIDVQRVDGKDPNELKNLAAFKSLTTIDPDFHYAVGDLTDNVSMRIVDVLCPIGRGQRGLIVAPPRTGKTTIMREFAAGIEKGFPDVHLMVLLVDERPEEATEWKRSTGGQVFVSTSDEMPKKHVQLTEAVWKRATRLVELGEDVVLLLDSITRLARAYNNLGGGTGRTMSGGLDSRAMERPRQIFGSARNTETAGSLTILGTALIETGSRMDQLIFEEFKGTGNMELVLSRKLADRRIFPAIDVERSGTRKEEKLIGARKLRWTSTLRRVLTRMNFIEAMELLITKLIDVEKTEDFLKRFEVDPEA